MLQETPISSAFYWKRAGDSKKKALLYLATKTQAQLVILTGKQIKKKKIINFLHVILFGKCMKKMLFKQWNIIRTKKDVEYALTLKATTSLSHHLLAVIFFFQSNQKWPEI